MRWTDSDNLRGREATVRDGPLAGMRITVNARQGQLRHPDVLDLGAYRFSADTWTFHYEPTDIANLPTAGGKTRP